MINNPYNNLKTNQWLKKTDELVKNHPLIDKEIVDVCLLSWNQIFTSTIGGVIKIGEEVKLTPQMVGNFLHVLIAHHLKNRSKDLWRKENLTDEKDIVYIPDDSFSFEIKTSSSKNDIYGNRSYGQQITNSKKSKNGFYLAINFDNPKKVEDPQITMIRFGWLGHSDWIPQKSPTGQQARLTPEAKKYKLIKLFVRK